MKNIRIVVNRHDGMGSRIIAIIHAFFLSDKLNINEHNIRIIWGELRNYTRNAHSNLIIKNEEGNIQLIGLAEANKEELFSEKFIEKYFIEHNLKGKQLSLDSKTYTTFSHLVEDINKNNYDVLISPLIDFSRIIKIEDINEEYRKKCSLMLERIEFAPKVQELIKEAKTKALEFGDFIVIHARSGDSIYDYADFRKFNIQSVFHATCCELVLGLIERNKDKKIVLVGDDVESLRECLKIANHSNLFVLSDISYKATNIESFIFDVFFMSKCSCMYGTNSAVVRLANYIGNQKFVNSYSVFSDEEYYKILKKYFNKIKVHPAQKAFSLFHLFLVSKKMSKSYQELISYLEKALEYDPENDKYRIHKVNCLLNAGHRQEAESYLKGILDLRESEFVKTLLLKGWIGVVYAEVFSNYFKFANCETPHLSFIASKIYESQKNLNQALKFAKLAYEAEPQNEIFKNHLLNLLLEQPTPQLKAIIKEKPTPSIYLVSAKDRIHSHLAYKLGFAMILNSKSLLGYIRMPYVLSYIKEAHQKEQKEYQARITKNPKLKLPKLESYADYKEALKEKECFTYKLGEALIKANSVRGGGQYLLTLPFSKKCVG